VPNIWIRTQSQAFAGSKQMIAALKFYYEKVPGQDKIYFKLLQNIWGLSLRF